MKSNTSHAGVVGSRKETAKPTRWLSAKKQKKLTRTPANSIASTRRLDVAIATASEEKKRRAQAKLTTYGFSAPNAAPVSIPAVPAAASAEEEAPQLRLDLDYADLMSPLRRLSRSKSPKNDGQGGGAAMATSPVTSGGSRFGAAPPPAWTGAAAAGAASGGGAARVDGTASSESEEEMDTPPGVFDYIDFRPKPFSAENEALLARLLKEYGPAATSTMES